MSSSDTRNPLATTKNTNESNYLAIEHTTIQRAVICDSAEERQAASEIGTLALV